MLGLLIFFSYLCLLLNNYIFMKNPFLTYHFNDPGAYTPEFNTVNANNIFSDFSIPIEFINTENNQLKDIERKKEEPLYLKPENKVITQDNITKPVYLKDTVKPVSKGKKLTIKEFRNKFYPDALLVANKLRIEPEVVLAQAYLETGGNPNLPMFGIKANKNYKGLSKSYNTKEEINGKIVNIKDSFRTYKTPADAFLDYGKFIQSGRYKNAVGKDALGYYQELKDKEYATGSGYVRSLMNVYNSFKKV